jgi:hypothetical protein
MRVECDYLRCTLWGDNALEICVRLCFFFPFPFPPFFLEMSTCASGVAICSAMFFFLFPFSLGDVKHARALSRETTL